MAQFAQPQVQEDFPLRLAFSILATMVATMAARTAQMIIVPIFAVNHESI
jgi:hypothetical protein